MVTVMKNEVLVETSARHVHISREDLDTLFGPGYELTNKKDLSQPGQFACEERVDVVGAKRTLAGVSILGPIRSSTQVELSMTDARSIGVDAPVRESGDIRDSAPCKLVGPKGEVELEKGVIIAKRHVHMTPADAEGFGLKDKDVVGIMVTSGGRSLIFGDVVVRVNPNFSLAVHIDTDEANAAGIRPGMKGEIVK
ncbi:MAG: phosphate propanoyltransferase [Oscillospiraceae bacterium]|nr:phosphate propanoyltransferase [Oscillospiraceae bacterium]MDD3833057.1 phosphate propanoyltransferase [Oscillospiraceae bacterium]